MEEENSTHTEKGGEKTPTQHTPPQDILEHGENSSEDDLRDHFNRLSLSEVKQHLPGWLSQWSEEQLRDVCKNYEINWEGDKEIMCDRLNRYVARRGGDSSVPWGPEDEIPEQEIPTTSKTPTQIDQGYHQNTGASPTSANLHQSSSSAERSWTGSYMDKTQESGGQSNHRRGDYPQQHPIDSTFVNTRPRGGGRQFRQETPPTPELVQQITEIVAEQLGFRLTPTPERNISSTCPTCHSTTYSTSDRNRLLYTNPHNRQAHTFDEAYTLPPPNTRATLPKMTTSTTADTRIQQDRVTGGRNYMSQQNPTIHRGCQEGYAQNTLDPLHRNSQQWGAETLRPQNCEYENRQPYDYQHPAGGFLPPTNPTTVRERKSQYDYDLQGWGNAYGRPYPDLDPRTTWGRYQGPGAYQTHAREQMLPPPMMEPENRIRENPWFDNNRPDYRVSNEFGRPSGWGNNRTYDYAQPVGIALTGQNRRPRDVTRIVEGWKISFDGTKGASVDNFLWRVEEGQAASFLTDEEMLVAMPFLLKDIAWLWFRANRKMWTRWSQCRLAFRSRFGDAFFQEKLEEQILARRQGAEESAADYITCMYGLYELSERPIDMTTQLNRVYSNLRPEFRRAIRRFDFADYQGLGWLASEFERASTSFGEEIPTPPPEKSLIPEYAYQEKSGNSNKPPQNQVQQKNSKGLENEDQLKKLTNRLETTIAALETAKKDSKSKTNPQDKTNHNKTGGQNEPKKNPSNKTKNAQGKKFETSKSEPQNVAKEGAENTEVKICYNCREPGHYQMGCVKPRRKDYCRRCGNEGTTTKDCCPENSKGEGK